MKRKITPITCKSALHRIGSGFPYSWDLNIYRGCEHGCRYCFAMYSHRYIGAEDYFNEIFVKTNIVEQLERELRKPGWRCQVVNIGGVTDSYQPAEATCRIMPEVLKLLIRYKTPAVISTKSNLILRDYDLIDELARITYVNVVATVTTMDEGLRRSLEPGGVASEERFEMLRVFRKTNASVGLHVMPIIPCITDSYRNLDTLFSKARDVGVHYVLPGLLNLRGETRKKFFIYIREVFPHLYDELAFLYKSEMLYREYREDLFRKVNGLLLAYNLSKNYNRPMEMKMKKQGLFF